MRKPHALIFIPLLLSFCGVRGNPTPPKRIIIPKPALKFWQMGKFLVVLPSLPETTEQGEKIIYREMKIRLEGKKEKQTIYRGEVRRKILVKIPDRFFGKKIRMEIEVRAKSARKLRIKTGLFTPIIPPLPPTRLKYSIKEEGIFLSWEEPKKNIKGEAVSPTGYIVFKNGRMGKPIYSPFYLDKRVVSGKKYTYRVSALLKSEPPYIMSMKSEKLTVEYRDKIPPSPPRDLEALPSGRDVYLQWSPSTSGDLAGYIIIRDGKPLTGKITSTSYWDRNLKPGKHIYQVVAVDRAGNKSQPSNKAEVEVQ